MTIISMSPRVPERWFQYRFGVISSIAACTALYLSLTGTVEMAKEVAFAESTKAETVSDEGEVDNKVVAIELKLRTASAAASPEPEHPVELPRDVAPVKEPAPSNELETADIGERPFEATFQPEAVEPVDQVKPSNDGQKEAIDIADIGSGYGVRIGIINADRPNMVMALLLNDLAVVRYTTDHGEFIGHGPQNPDRPFETLQFDRTKDYVGRLTNMRFHSKASPLSNMVARLLASAKGVGQVKPAAIVFKDGAAQSIALAISKLVGADAGASRSGEGPSATVRGCFNADRVFQVVEAHVGGKIVKKTNVRDCF